MKSTTLSKRVGSKKDNARKNLSGVLRTAKRGSAYAFVASLGIWLPRAEAATLINLDSTALGTGPLSTWNNTGTVSGNFASSGDMVPEVVVVDGVNCVALTNAVGTPGGAVGTQYVGPNTPAAVGGSNPRTVEAWIYDPGTSNVLEKTILGFGRRANPLEFALGHGTDTDVGAVNAAGGRGAGNHRNIGWKDTANIVRDNWTYIVASFDGNTLSVYSDGVLINSEKFVPTLLNTALIGSDGTTPMQFRVARQNLNGAPTGSASGVGVGPFYAGRIRVKDTAMTASDVATQYNTEKPDFGYKDTDLDGMQDWYESRFGLNPGSNADAGLDPDTDGATNLEESQWGSDPNVADTDGDGINDGTEIHRTNPISTLSEPTNPTKVDSDGDGLNDPVETGTGTYVSPADTGSNPTKSDTDGDSYSDGVEVAKLTNPNSSGSAPIPLISLDATTLPAGSLSTWTNLGSVVGDFTSVSLTNVPAVTNIDGVAGVNFTTQAVVGNGGSNGTSYFGPTVPSQITGAGARTVDAWVYNETIQNEETMFSFGARAYTPNTGANVSFGMGRNGGFGACAQWGAPDIGWNNQEFYGRWTHIAYTYDGTATRIYSDGVLVDTEAFALVTAVNGLVDAQPFHFRIARQNGPNTIGQIDTTGAGEFTMARVRVFDTALDGPSIKARFDAEKGTFGLNDTDTDGMPDWYEIRWGFDKNNSADGGATDSDTDGLTNAEESQQRSLAPNAPLTYRVGTTPNLADTDGDTVNDGPEVNRTDAQTGFHSETNPFLTDTDGDTLTDGVETDTGTFVSNSNTGSDPVRGDTDGDSYLDGVEVNSGTNPNDPNSFPDPSPKVNLIATNLPPGTLLTWTNLGTLGSSFAAGGSGGTVLTNQGMRSVTFDGTGYYTAYIVPTTGPSNLVGNPSYSIEAWIYNTQSPDEETIFAWGRRGGNPDGSNCSFNHGVNGAYGAMGHWGGPDLGWGAASNIVNGRWTYVVYTYNAATLEQRCYADGNFANNEILGAPLAIASIDSSNVALPFRIASQNDANGVPSAGFRGTLAIGELRVYTRVMTPAEVTTGFTNGATAYGLRDQDNDGMPSWYERQYPGCLNENSNLDATQDCDGDTLSNLDEYVQGSSPVLTDSDGDGLTDGNEVNVHGTNPTNRDTDWDGVEDGRELVLGTFPVGAGSADSDTDGYSDGTEVLYGTDPLSGASVPDTSTPRPYVNLDATGFDVGALPTWTNNNALGWNFVASTNSLSVNVVDGTRGVTFNGNSYYSGPGSLTILSGNAARTVEAWFWNPAVPDEETVFAWGRRGGPDGSNSGFAHGTNPVFGALQMWGAFDAPWGATAQEIASNAVPGRWTFAAYTYDPTNVLKSVYKDGVLVFSNTNTGPANTHLYDPSDPRNTANPPTGRALNFRVGAQNDASGGAAGPFATMTIAKVRAYDVALSASQIAADYNAERVQFPGQPVITNVRYHSGSGMIQFDWVPAFGHTYRVETNANLLNPNGWAPAETGLSTGTYSNSASGDANNYRLKIE